MKESTVCHVCSADQLQHQKTYPKLPRVASDCVPWRAGGRLASCTNCGCVQNPVDELWHNETAEVYSEYKIYTQSDGCEKGIFLDGKKVMSRSAKVLEQAKPFLNLEKPGRLLDVGCANGELLRCFGKIAPHWKMVGFEIDEKRRKEVESTPNVEAFYSCSIDKISATFDIITLIHVFEHLPYPNQWLNQFRKLLKPDGIVLIQVPDPKKNPYNLLVADHCSHFLMSDLIKIAERADYEVITCADSWVAREFSIIIKPIELGKAKNKNEQSNKRLTEKTSTYPANSLNWLDDIIQLTKSIPINKPRGIWGTAIAATWVYSIMENNVDFFVDEDPSRIGQTHLGKPIISPEQIPEGSNVFIALTPEIANTVVGRWSKLSATLHKPPALHY